MHKEELGRSSNCISYLHRTDLLKCAQFIAVGLFLIVKSGALTGATVWQNSHLGIEFKSLLLYFGYRANLDQFRHCLFSFMRQTREAHALTMCSNGDCEFLAD